jgi:signal transduction histidine kinase
MVGGPKSGGEQPEGEAGHQLGLGAPPSSRQLLFAACAAASTCLVLALILGVASMPETWQAGQVVEAFRIIAAAMFVGAGVLRIYHWRIAEDDHSALMGVALLVLGALVIPLGSLAAMLHDPATGSLHEQVVRGVAVGVVIAMVVKALESSIDEERVRPGSLFLAAMVGTMVAFLVVLSVDTWSPDTLQGALWSKSVVELGLAAAWFAVAGRAWSRRGRLEWAGRVAPLLGAMAAVSIFRAIGVQGQDGFLVAAATLSAVVAYLSAYSALLDLVHLTTTDRAQLRTFEEALARAREVARSDVDRREEVNHDARNALAGVRGALLTLERYADNLDAATVTRLRAAAIEEVGHLEHLIVRTGDDRRVDFEVGPVVRAVAATRRVGGLDVRLRDIDGWACGRAGDVSTALHNLLINAAVHAPGSPVQMWVQQTSECVELHVVDQGPGVPDADAQAIFQRGRRGRASSGSGLGLYVARQVMIEQGGDLRLEQREQGCEFVLSLPVAQHDCRTSASTLPLLRPALRGLPTLEVS